ncbi:DUF433 domain-containing protein [Fibrisoma montanum]|uniref:DUF433 domain-containing protein n=1 Tax=Fibrisoma montanum TaxID=2305895 RepID=A0A418M3S2_9BACT|nr:DUF433 domain-containing protein [Fibrisoma montanum]
MKRTRTTVEPVVERMGHGEMIHDILEAYPHLTRASVLICLHCAANA